MNMFEQATRLKLRFAVGTRVNLTVENLWDLPLTNVKGEDLDHIAIELQEHLSTNEKSFVVQQSKTKETQVNQLKFDIVKHIIDVRLEEQKVANLERQRAQEIATLKELQKQAKIRDLQNLSSEEIEERIKSLEKQ
jgi:hypothetical protein